MIEFNQVSKKYPGGHLALYNVSLKLEAGEMAFLTGHSGAGKTTLLKLIAMIETPNKGQIAVGGQLLSNLAPRKIPWHRRKIGFIYQNPHLLSDRSVFDNVALPLIIAGLRQHEVRHRVRAALDKVGLLKREKANPITLSAGEQQRVGIARAVVNKPAIILADEPTGNLDPELAQDIMHTFSQFNELGTTVLIASHDLNLVRLMEKRILVLQKIPQG